LLRPLSHISFSRNEALICHDPRTFEHFATPATGGIEMNAINQAAEAFRVFERWQAEHDPDGEMELLEAAAAYSAWAETNSIAKYLDSAQQSPQESVTENDHG
jgi:hypothetical protein